MEHVFEEDVLKRLDRIESQLLVEYMRPMNFVEATIYLSVSHSHLYKLTSMKMIPHHKPMGKYLYFYKSELDEWVRSSRREKVKAGKTEVSSKDRVDLH